MTADPHPEYLVHESLADRFDAPKVQFYLAESLQSGEQTLRLATTHELGPYFEQFDNRPRTYEVVVLSELAEQVGQVSIRVEVQGHAHRGPFGDRARPDGFVLALVVNGPANPIALEHEEIDRFRREEDPLTGVRCGIRRTFSLGQLGDGGELVLQIEAGPHALEDADAVVGDDHSDFALIDPEAHVDMVAGRVV